MKKETKLDDLFPKELGWSSQYLNALWNYKKSFFTFLILLLAVSLFYAAKLRLKTDFSLLLPNQLNSVQNIEKVKERIGGNSLLVIGVKSPSFQANKRFVEDLATELQKLVGNDLRYFDYKFKEVEDFLYRYGLHYLSTEQISDFNKSLEKQINKKKDNAFSSFLGLDDDEEKQSSADFEKEFEKWISEVLDPSFKKFLNYREAYLSANEGSMMVLALKPKASSLGISESKKLVDKIDAIIKQLDPSKYDSKLEYRFSGNVQQSIEEFTAIKDDLFGTATILTLLICAVLFIFFWSYKVIFLLIFQLVYSIIITFALTYLKIGYLNSQTAFLGSLVVGTGVNYSIILLSRYLELRRSGKSIEHSLSQAINGTLIATLIASATTTVSFACLLYTQNKGLSQFAFIGGIGVAICWITAFSLLPVFLYIFESKLTPIKTVHPLKKYIQSKGTFLGNNITHHPKIYLSFFVLMTLLSTYGVYKLYENPLEYNFDNVRNKHVLSPEVKSFRKEAHSVFSTDLNPSVVLADNLEESKMVCPKIEEIRSSLAEKDRVIHSCLSLFNYYPKTFTEKEQAYRTQLLRHTKELLDTKVLKYADSARHISQLKQKLSLNAPEVRDIPLQISRRFEEIDGRQGLVSYVNPNSDMPLNDARNLNKFVNALEKVELPDGEKVSAAGNFFILHDLLEGIKKDGPRISLLSFFGVLLVMLLLLKGAKRSLLVGFSLILAVFWMVGLQGLFQIKYNFFNFIALPLTFGIGIDYPINVYIRCQQEKFRNYGKILSHSGAAVLLCSLTTIISYFTLFGATSQALVSFAKLAFLGEITCLLMALVGVPLFLRLAKKFQDA